MIEINSPFGMYIQELEAREETLNNIIKDYHTANGETSLYDLFNKCDMDIASLTSEEERYIKKRL